MSAPRVVPLDLKPGEPVALTCMCGRKFRVHAYDRFIAEQDAYGTCRRHYVEHEPRTTARC